MSFSDKNIQYFSERSGLLPKIGGLDRSVAMSIFQGLGMPHAKLEKWQKSKIKQALSLDYEMAVPEQLPTMEVRKESIFDGLPASVFVNGIPVDPSGLTKTAEGWVIGTLNEALHQYPELVSQHLNRYIKEDLNGLNALNNALFDRGFFLYVPKNTVAELPAYWLNHFAGETPLFTQQRNLIIVEEGAHFTLLHSDNGTGGGSVFTNSVTEVYVGANARFEWYREQDLRKNDTLVNSVFTHMERDSYLKIINTTLHGNMVRNDVHVKMDGTGCESHVLGLYLPHTGEQVDNQVFMEHAKPHCVSNELFKGVLDGKGSSIFNGHILVAQDAQKTNAYQTNRNVVLSDEANAFAKPFLEIYADDVRCSHGATVGQLDENALFYLRSRGLSLEKARSFLIKAFVGEVIDEVNHEGFRERLVERVNNKLEEK
jgi:Fe-S cluster assembly protein SufD